jgi:hypothetical protein
MDKYDTLEYFPVKAITVSIRLRNFLCALINTNNCRWWNLGINSWGECNTSKTKRNGLEGPRPGPAHHHPKAQVAPNPRMHIPPLSVCLPFPSGAPLQHVFPILPYILSFLNTSPKPIITKGKRKME